MLKILFHTLNTFSRRLVMTINKAINFETLWGESYFKIWLTNLNKCVDGVALIFLEKAPLQYLEQKAKEFSW